MSESKVFLFNNDDPEMQRAFYRARDTFRYFWREVAWERRRIIPGLNMAAVKAPFHDGEEARGHPENPEVEHMWMSEIDFDGQFISGTLLNSPNWLKSVKEGDQARKSLDEISDWMYVQLGDVYGAYTVNLMRSRMSKRERQEHDEAWGLNFGDPDNIRVVPEPEKKKEGFLGSLFGKRKVEEKTEIGEHPMSENAAPGFEEQLSQQPELANDKDDNGWTFLHHQALAGSYATVKVLLDHGADPNEVTSHGMTPLQLAESLRWDKVIALLKSKGAK